MTVFTFSFVLWICEIVLRKAMSDTNINNLQDYENFTYPTTMNNDPTSTYSEEDDYFYDAEIIPYNDTHYCLNLLENSEVRII